ncbi:hypothetical protein GIB67_034941 [Kingdonia uniflora]|uniref:Uncharacterized protein n=1 Tax=Kingdonia uniflora TaxID=39325 RepID=A0A7J7NHB1_9MAGN|nr:hypothetical protein GIB67_034941 [Kingdonia uniflora]
MNMNMVHNHHFLLVTFAAQGHINPVIQFAKRLIRMGAQVTIATTIYAQRRMSKIPDGLTFSFFSDGFDDGFKHGEHEYQHYMSEIKRRGSESLSEKVLALAEEPRPVSCLVYTLLLPWVAEVARKHSIPSALLWIQPATVFDIYYYYFVEGYKDVLSNNIDDPSYSVKFPGLPTLTSPDLPSFFVASSAFSVILECFQEQFDELVREGTKQWVLVNTFDALEFDALRAIEKFNLIGVGPLLPSAFLDGKDPSDTCFGVDLFSVTKDYVEWLNTKEKSSVVYISFGSLTVLEKWQMD